MFCGGLLFCFFFFPSNKAVSQKFVWFFTFVLCSCIHFLWFLTSKILYFFCGHPIRRCVFFRIRRHPCIFFVFSCGPCKWERHHLKFVPQAVLILLYFLLNKSQIGLNIYFQLNNKTPSAFQSQYDVKTLELTVGCV